MNWIKSSDRLPEELPEYVCRKRIKCLVAYETQSGWNWKAILRYKVHDDWKWGERLSPDYWCIPENPYIPAPDWDEETGTIWGGVTLVDLYEMENVGATALFVVRNELGEIIESCKWENGDANNNERTVMKYRLCDFDSVTHKYGMVEAWLK